VTSLKELATPVPCDVIPAKAGIQSLSQQRKTRLRPGFAFRAPLRPPPKSSHDRDAVTRAQMVLFMQRLSEATVDSVNFTESPAGDSDTKRRADVHERSDGDPRVRNRQHRAICARARQSRSAPTRSPTSRSGSRAATTAGRSRPTTPRFRCQRTGRPVDDGLGDDREEQPPRRRLDHPVSTRAVPRARQCDHRGSHGASAASSRCGPRCIQADLWHRRATTRLRPGCCPMDPSRSSGRMTLTPRHKASANRSFRRADEAGTIVD
jgi:hypothetical protein